MNTIMKHKKTILIAAFMAFALMLLVNAGLLFGSQRAAVGAGLPSATTSGRLPAIAKDMDEVLDALLNQPFEYFDQVMDDMRVTKDDINNFRDDVHNNSLLTHAIRWVKLRAVESLVNRGADIVDTNDDLTALEYAQNTAENVRDDGEDADVKKDASKIVTFLQEKELDLAMRELGSQERTERKAKPKKEDAKPKASAKPKKNKLAQKRKQAEKAAEKRKQKQIAQAQAQSVKDREVALIKKAEQKAQADAEYEKGLQALKAELEAQEQAEIKKAIQNEMKANYLAAKAKRLENKARNLANKPKYLETKRIIQARQAQEKAARLAAQQKS